VRVQGDSADLFRGLCAVYRHFTPLPAADWRDLHVRILPGHGLRRWVAPQVRFFSDGSEPFEPFPASHALPLLEWGMNWLIARRMNDVLLLHAGVLERDGLALVMPALPGSGKSTLTAALSLRGWRLLSDEFGAYDVTKRAFRAVLKPVALKNASIDVIRAFEPTAPLGPSFDRTRKGTVAHLAPDRAAVAALHRPAAPGAVVFPRWQKGVATSLTDTPAQVAFSSLAFNAFNYTALGAEGFKAAVELTRRMPAWQLLYSDLDDAIATIDRLWPQVCDRAAAGAPSDGFTATGDPSG
jgi:HprK-related kinase A